MRGLEKIENRMENKSNITEKKNISAQMRGLEKMENRMEISQILRKRKIFPLK